MSPKALMHSEENEFEHKAIFIAEYEGVAGADYAIRTMQSEQLIEWQYVESTKGGIQKKARRVKGPAAFIQATTRVTLHPENETRLLFLQMDESEEQTHAINKRQAEEAEGKIQTPPISLYNDWHDFLGSLQASSIRIPFASRLAEALPGRVRSRRDLPKLLGLIEASAYLHQHQRMKDEEGRIIAAEQDYYNAKEIFEHSYHTGPDAKLNDMLKAARHLGNEEFSVPDLVRETGWGKTKIYQVLDRAEELGCIIEGERRGYYALLQEHPRQELRLPDDISSGTGFRNSANTPSISAVTERAPFAEKRKTSALKGFSRKSPLV
jgi:hypothetical protein